MRAGEADAINTYSSWNWVVHLSKATSARRSTEILVQLHQFFMSDGVKQWVKDGLLPNLYMAGGLQISGDDACLNDICEWLRKCQTSDPKEEGTSVAEHVEIGDLLE